MNKLNTDNNTQVPELPYTIRLAIPSDIPFIYSSWLNSYRFGSSNNKNIRTSVFFESYREVLDHILAKSQLLVACMNEEPTVILGYICYDAPVNLYDHTTHDVIVHYIFVKEAFRRLGIMSQLTKIATENKPFTYTHLTNMIVKYAQSNNNWTYNPFFLYTSGTNNEEDEDNSHI